MTVDLRGATYSASRIIKGRTKQFGWLQAPATNYRTCLTIQFTFPVTMRPKVLGFVPRLDNSLFLEALPFMAFSIKTNVLARLRVLIQAFVPPSTVRFAPVT